MEFLEFVYKYFLIHNIEILEINWKLWCYKNNTSDNLVIFDFSDLYISAMQGIFLQEGAIILDAHTLNIRCSVSLLLLSLFSRPL